MARRPKPPPGQGAAVLWTGRSRRTLGTAFAGALALCALLFTLATGGVSWAASPALWALSAALSAVVALIAWSRTATMAAGADWFRAGGVWVHTAKLVRVKFVPGPRPVLHLEDASGRDLTVDLLALSAHPALSAHLTTRLRAAAPHLPLDPPTTTYLNSL